MFKKTLANATPRFCNFNNDEGVIGASKLLYRRSAANHEGSDSDDSGCDNDEG